MLVFLLTLIFGVKQNHIFPLRNLNRDVKLYSKLKNLPIILRRIRLHAFVFIYNAVIVIFDVLAACVYYQRVCLTFVYFFLTSFWSFCGILYCTWMMKNFFSCISLLEVVVSVGFYLKLMIATSFVAMPWGYWVYTRICNIQHIQGFRKTYL